LVNAQRISFLKMCQEAVNIFDAGQFFIVELFDNSAGFAMLGLEKETAKQEY